MAAYGSNAYGSTEYGGQPPQIFVAVVSPLVINLSLPAVSAINDADAMVTPLVINVTILPVTATFQVRQDVSGGSVHKVAPLINPIVYMVGIKKVGWGITQKGEVRLVPTVGGRHLENPLHKNKRGVLVER